MVSEEARGERGLCFVVVSSVGKQMKSVEDLDVFKLAHQLALKTYAVTKGFPREETFSLVDQMRAASSVEVNLMEAPCGWAARNTAYVELSRPGPILEVMK
jgi:hypothetical protein